MRLIVLAAFLVSLGGCNAPTVITETGKTGAVDQTVPADLRVEVDLTPRECTVDGDCFSGRSCCGDTCVDLHVDVANCGACGKARGAGEACCGSTCVPDLQTNIFHCGGCDTVCPAPDHATPGCKRGKCGVGTCAPGFADCDQDFRGGCEVDVLTDAKNCGACGKECASKMCSAGKCL